MLKPMRYIHLQCTCTSSFLLLEIKKEKKRIVFPSSCQKLLITKLQLKKQTQSDTEHRTLINTIGITLTGTPHLWNTIRDTIVFSLVSKLSLSKYQKTYFTVIVAIGKCVAFDWLSTLKTPCFDL